VRTMRQVVGTERVQGVFEGSSGSSLSARVRRYPRRAALPVGWPGPPPDLERVGMNEDLEQLEDDLIGQLEQLVSQATHIAGMLERVRALRGESPSMNAPRLMIVR
jgi:hypothetical protein